MSLISIIRNKEKIGKGKFPNLQECLGKCVIQCWGENILVGGFLLKEKVINSLYSGAFSNPPLIIQINDDKLFIGSSNFEHDKDLKVTISRIDFSVLAY